MHLNWMSAGERERRFLRGRIAIPRRSSCLGCAGLDINLPLVTVMFLVVDRTEFRDARGAQHGARVQQTTRLRYGGKTETSIPTHDNQLRISTSPLVPLASLSTNAAYAAIWVVWAGDIPRGATTCVRPVELKGSRLSFAISRAGNFRRDFPLLPGKFIELRNLASRVHQDRARRRLHVRGAGRGLALRACAGDCTCNARPPPRNPREASTRLNRPTERDQLRSLERLMPLIEDDVLLRSLLAEWLSAEGYRVTDKA